MKKGAQCTTEKGTGLGCLGPGGLQGSHMVPRPPPPGLGTPSIMRPQRVPVSPPGPSFTAWPLLTRIPQATQEGFVRCLNRNERDRSRVVSEVNWPVHPSVPLSSQSLSKPLLSPLPGAGAGGEQTSSQEAPRKRTAVRLYFSVK